MSCIVFDIDGMLFEFFMNFWNIEKYIYLYFFLEKQLFLISFRVLCYSQHLKKNFLRNIEKFPFTCWLNGRWFLQIVDREF